MSATQWQQLHELRKKAGLIKGKKTPESSRALEARVATLEAKTDNSSNESLFPEEKLKASNSNYSALDRNRNGTRQSHADTWWVGLLKGDSQFSKLKDIHLKPLSTVRIMVAHASIASSKPKVKLDSYADMCVVGDNCLGVHDYNRPVNVYSYNPEDGHKSARTVNAAVGYQATQSGWRFILIINQAIHTDGLVNHLLCPMQCHLNSMHVNKIPKFLAENPSETTHTIELFDPFDVAHPLIILLQLSMVTSYSKVLQSMKMMISLRSILLPPWDPSTDDFSEREIRMTNHQGQINIPSTVARGPVFASTVVSYSLAYDAVDVIDNDNLTTALESQIQISIVLIGMVRKPSIDPIVLAKWWGINPEKAQKTIKATTQRGIWTMLHPSLMRWLRTNDWNLHYCCLAHPAFSVMMFASTMSRRGNRCAQVYATDFGWTRAFSMASRSEAHETLLLLFVRNGVPPTCICNNAKEIIHGKFSQKLKDAACHLKRLEPYTPWSNAAEREIKELKKGTGCKLLKSRAPKQLWDDCTELEAYIRSNTAHEIYPILPTRCIN